MTSRRLAIMLLAAALATVGCSSGNKDKNKDKGESKPTPAPTDAAKAAQPRTLDRQYIDAEIEKLRQLAAGKKDTVLFDVVTKLEVLVADAIAGRAKTASLLKRFDEAIRPYVGKHPQGGETMQDLSATGMLLHRLKPAMKLGDALARVRIDAVNEALTALALTAQKGELSAADKKLLGSKLLIAVKQYNHLNKSRVARSAKRVERLSKLGARSLARLKTLKDGQEKQKLERTMNKFDQRLMSARRIHKRAHDSSHLVLVKALYKQLTMLGRSLVAAGSTNKSIEARFNAVRDAFGKVAVDLRHLLTFRKASAILNAMRPRLSR